MTKSGVKTTSDAGNLVSDLPASIEVIDKLLRRRGDTDNFEMHFSIFVQLGNLDLWSVDQKTRREILSMMESYCNTVKIDKANAVFAAVDTLVFDWPLDLTLPSLSRILQFGQYWHAKQQIALVTCKYINYEGPSKIKPLRRHFENCVKMSDGKRARIFENTLAWIDGETKD